MYFSYVIFKVFTLVLQVEVMGLSIYDFSHPCDHGDIKEMLAVGKKDGKDHEETATTSRSSTFRMKCTITARGRNVHLRAASYKVSTPAAMIRDGKVGI